MQTSKPESLAPKCPGLVPHPSGVESKGSAGPPDGPAIREEGVVVGEKPEGNAEAKKATEGGGKSSEQMAPGDSPGGSPEPTEASNLNSSKSNVARGMEPGGGPEPAEATNLNSSRSNIYRKAPESGSGEPTQAGAE